MPYGLPPQEQGVVLGYCENCGHPIMDDEPEDNVSSSFYQSQQYDYFGHNDCELAKERRQTDLVKRWGF